MRSSVVVKREPSNKELLQTLLESKVIFANIILDSDKYILDRWQRSYLEDNSKIISILKNRRVGALRSGINNLTK